MEFWNNRLIYKAFILTYSIVKWFPSDLVPNHCCFPLICNSNSCEKQKQNKKLRILIRNISLPEPHVNMKIHKNVKKAFKFSD